MVQQLRTLLCLAQHELHPRRDDPLHDLRLHALVLAWPRCVHHDIRDRYERPAEPEPLAPALLDHEPGVRRRKTDVDRTVEGV